MQHIIVSIVSFLALWVIFAFTGATVSLALLQAMITSTLLGAVVFLHGKPRVWYKDRAMALAAVTLVDISGLAFYFGWTWTGWLFAFASIGCFIRYSCRWGNWCQKAKAWWLLKGKQQVKNGLHTGWTWFEQGCEWIKTDAFPWVSEVVESWKPAFTKHFAVILGVVSGIIAYWLYDDRPLWSSTLRGWTWHMAFFWIFAITSILSFISLEPARKGLAKLISAVLSIAWTKYKAIDKKYEEETQTKGKLIFWLTAGLGGVVVTTLIHEKFSPGNGWAFKMLEIHGRFHVTLAGIIAITAIFLGILFVLQLLLPSIYVKNEAEKKKDKKKTKEEERIEARHLAAKAKLEGEKAKAEYLLKHKSKKKPA